MQANGRRMLHSFDFHLVASLNTHGTGQKMFGPSLFEASQGYKRDVRAVGGWCSSSTFLWPHPGENFQWLRRQRLYAWWMDSL